MYAEELISRLNAKTQSYSIQIQGNRNTLTPSDIAAAIGLARAPEAAKYLARVRYAGQLELSSKVTYALFDIINKKYHPHTKRKSYKSGLLTDMAMLAVGEYVQSDRCKSCRGVGERLIDHQKVLCPDCEGVGITLKHDEPRSVKLGLVRSTWNQSGKFTSWSKIYREMLYILGNWDRKICNQIRL